jgi:hypothetical protein
MSATPEQMSFWMHSLQRRIKEDFGLATHPPAERAEMLERLTSMVMKGALLDAMDFLSEDESVHLEKLAEGDGSSSLENQQYVTSFIISKAPDFGSLMDKAYEEVKRLSVEIAEKEKEKKFEKAEQYNEAVGDLTELVEGGVEDAGVEVPGLSALSAGLDLLYDPAKFRRSPRERQERLFKHLSVLICKALGLAWFGLVTFTVLETLEHRHVIGSVPKIYKEAVPNWYERQTIGGQMSSLGILAVGGVILAFVIMWVLSRIARSPRVTKAFELKVGDEELATNVVRSLFNSTYPLDMTEENIWGSAKLVYQSVYLESRNANQEDYKMLKEILDNGNERAAVEFLKSKTRGYKYVMREKAEEYCKDAANIMGQIK